MGWSLKIKIRNLGSHGVVPNVEILWGEKNEADTENNRNKWAIGERESERLTPWILPLYFLAVLVRALGSK